MYFVYILLCQGGSFYTGMSTNPEQRLIEHKAGKGGAYTRSHRPVKIIYVEQQVDKPSALKREFQIKTWSRQKKITTLNLMGK